MHLKNTVKTKSRQLMLIGAIMIIIISALGIYRIFYQKSPAPNKKLVTAVHTSVIKQKDLIKNISLIGQTIPKAQVDIAAKYAGKIVAVNVDLGQKVTTGQILIEQDAKDAALSVNTSRHVYNQAAADLQTAQAQLNSSYSKYKADYNQALVNYRRNKEVFAVGGISASNMDIAIQQLEDAKANLKLIEDQISNGVASSVTSAEENVKKAQSALAAAQKQENDMFLISSIDGIVGYRQVEPGDMVTAGQKLLSIYDNSLIYVDYLVSEQDLPAFSLQMPLTVNIDSLSNVFTGNIIYISPTVDLTSLTYTLRVLLDNSSNVLKSGMFARATVKSVLRSNVLTVPKTAVVSKNGKTYVFIINDDSTVTQKDIILGVSGNDDFEVLSGLSANETVAVDNLSRLRDGLTVNPLPDESGTS